MTEVAHLTSAHPRYDTRIFLKQCTSLVRAGYEPSLVVADGKGDDVKDGVRIYDVGASLNRMDRIRYAPGRVLTKALELDVKAYHLHDPELIPIGLRLKKAGKVVIFDAHEDVPKQLLSKPYLNKPSKRIMSTSLALYERWALKKVDAVVAATPQIRDKFRSMGIASIDINNFPIVGELVLGEVDWETKEDQVCYIGGISRIRGILEVVEAMARVDTDARLQLVGAFAEADVEESAHNNFEGWSRVDALGFLERDGVAEVLQRSIGGVVTFLPAPNHIAAQPNKMFEYMSAGIPVIASDFPLWREIVLGNRCGLCVNPRDPSAIAMAIDYLTAHPGEAENMGRNGQRAVAETYNWAAEEQKLLGLYEEFV